jgi:hypothetical protein
MYRILISIILIVITTSCKTTKSTIPDVVEFNKETLKKEKLEFDCYYLSDTIENLILYFPEKKEFYINNKLHKSTNVCDEIEYSIENNKGVKHCLHPQSNFFYMISIQRKVEECYKNKIDKISQEKYGLTYENLDVDQRKEIDKILTYRVVSE